MTIYHNAFRYHYQEVIVVLDLGLDYKRELLRQIDGLSAEKIKEILDFACFVRAKDAIDPSQAYFWTTKWQTMEAEAEQDKKEGNVLGDGTLNDLLNELRK